MNYVVEVKLKDIMGQINRNMSQALSMLCEQIRADSDKYVPRLTGDLRTFVDIESHGNEADLIYNSKYASYQWYGVGMQNYTTPGTGPEWCEKARNVYEGEWIKVLSNGLLNE